MSVPGPGPVPGQAPQQNFFRDQIYASAKQAGVPVPWDVKQAQPALASVQHIFSGSVLDVG